MLIGRREFLAAGAALLNAGWGGVAAAPVVLTIKVELSNDRTQPGTLRLISNDVSIAGPFPAYGRSDTSVATKHGNASRDPAKPYGDTPTGSYEVPRVISTGSGAYNSHSYGPNGGLVLKPVSGQAAAAVANGRIGLLIHGGDPGVGGKLRATHGCLRLSNDDVAKLMAAIIAAGENASFQRCDVTRIDADFGVADPVCGEDAGDPPPGIAEILKPGSIRLP